MLERLRNWWRTPSKPPAEHPELTLITPSEPIETLQELAARVRELEAQSSQLQLAWSETLDKLGRWASKQAARERRRVDRDLDVLADGPESHEDAPGTMNGGGSDLPVGGQPDRAAMKAQLRARAASLIRR